MCVCFLQAEPIRVCVTGAAGQIAYSLLYSIANGDVFGKDQVCMQLHHHHHHHLSSPPLIPHVSSPLQPLILILLDITPMMTCLGGVVMELQDCALTLLKGKLNCVV